MDRTSSRRGIAEAIQAGVPYVVQVAEHLSDILGPELTNVLATAVAAPTDATARLLVTLANLEPSSPRTLEYVTNALGSEKSVLVDAAAEAAMILPSTEGLSSVLLGELTRWRKWAAGEGPLEKRDSGIVEPGTTLYAKGVAEKLVKALAVHGALAYDDLVLLAREGAGAGQALNALVAAAGRDAVLLERALDDIASGALSARAAELLFRLDGVPPNSASRLLSFHEHPKESVRRAVVAGLRDCAWVAREEARRIWTARLADSDAGIRDEAHRSLEERPMPPSAG